MEDGCLSIRDIDRKIIDIDCEIASIKAKARMKLAARSLKNAVQREDLSDARRLLEGGTDANCFDGFSRPLNVAGSKDAIRLLLEYGADPKQCKESPLRTVFLHYGSLQAHYKPQDMSEQDWLQEASEALGLLFKAGADANALSDCGNNLLYDIATCTLSSDASKEFFLTKLMQNGADPNELYVKYRFCKESVLGYLDSEIYPLKRERKNKEIYAKWVALMKEHAQG